MKTTRNLDSKYVMRDDGIAQQVCTNYANCAADRCSWSPYPRRPKQLKTQNLTLKSATDSGDSYVCDFGSEKVTIKHFNTPPNDETYACGAAASSTPNIPLIYAPLPSNDSSKWVCDRFYFVLIF